MSDEFKVGDRVRSRVLGKGEGAIISIDHPPDGTYQIMAPNLTYTILW